MEHLLHSFVVVSQRLANALTATGRSAQRRSAAADPAQESAESAPAFTKTWMALAFLAFAFSSQQAEAQGSFRIKQLLTTGVVGIDVNGTTNDDRGGIAVGTSHVLLTGDDVTAGASAADLSGVYSTGRIYDALCANLRTETIYTLGNGGVPTGGGGTVSELLEIDGATGQLSGSSITLSQSISLTSGFGTGIFSGWDRIVVQNDDGVVYDINLQTGGVTNLGSMAIPQHQGTENWAYWGLAEYWQGQISIVYVRYDSGHQIVRTTVPGGVTTVIQSFDNLGDMASIGFSASRNRWYFHNEGGGILGLPGLSESLGYADATWESGVTTLPVSDVTTTSATMNGQANPLGLETTAWFEWSTSPTLAGATSTMAVSLGSGNVVVPISSPLTNLTAETTYYYEAVMNNSEGTVRGGIVSFYTGPEIAVEQPVKTDRVDGTATVDFHEALISAPSPAKTFTIRNRGNLPLTGLAITQDGANPGDFTVSALGSTTVAPGESITFTVTVTPSALGARSAVLHIASNDVDENTFDIHLTATGVAVLRIVGVSDLLTAPDVVQLQSWLGEAGTMVLTKVFSRAPGDGKTSFNFHAAVDGIGRTFTVVEVPEQGGYLRKVVGGYNPQSWHSNDDYTFSYDDSERTAFLFNLTSGLLQRQRLVDADNGYGPYQTYNGTYYGPTFGGGHDLYMPHDLGEFYVSSYSYGTGSNITEENQYYGTAGRMEVFTVSFSAAVTAPEIAVEQPVDTGVADAGSKAFGTVDLGGTTSLTFTIKNTGNADLTGLVITKDGANEADFTVTATPTAPVAGPSGLTTFEVQFAPGAAGARTAVLHIASNDANENPYDITLTGVGSTAAVAGGVLSLNPGAGATNDRVTISLVAGKIRITDPNNALFAGAGGTQVDANTIEFPLAGLTGLTFNGSDGDDVFTVDLSGGNPLPDNLTFNGGGGDDALRVVGNGQVVVYTPDAVTNGSGSILAGAKTISFTGLEPIDFVGVAFTLSLPGANDIVDVANGFLIDGITPATVITGTSGGVGFENARVSNCSIVIDTTGVAGTDAVTVTSADNAHLNSSLTVTTGAEVGDVITVNGTTTVSGTTTLNAATVALNAVVTNAVSGSVATTITVASPGQIQDGISVAASTGGTLTAGSGTFTENLVLNKQLTFRGAQVGVDARGRVATETILTPAVPATRLLEIATGAGASTIDGFTFSGGVRQIETNGGTFHNLTIQNNRFVGFTGQALFINDPGTDVTVTRNSVDGSSTTGGGGLVHFDTDNFNGLYFTNNWVRNGTGRTGFFVDGNHNVGPSVGRTPLIDGNLIDGNQTGMNLGSRSFGSFTVSNAGTISNNTISNSGFDGLQGGLQHVLVTGNVFSGNARAGMALTSFGNTGADRGGQNSVVTQNAFSGNGTSGSAGSGDLVFSATQVAGSISTNVAYGNSFTSVRGVAYDEVNVGEQETINCSGNWWGSASGPSLATHPGGAGAPIFGAASHKVDFTPWLAAGTDTSVTAGFQGDFSSLRVDDDSAQTGVTGRIQEGVNTLTATGTLGVESGTYAENVDTSTKTVTLAAGASPGQVVVNGSFTLDGNDTLPVEINGLTAGTGYDQWVVNGAVTLGGATLSLSGSHTPVVLNQSFTLVDNDVADAVTGTFNGLAEGALISNFLGSAYSAKVSYVGGDGNDVTLKAVTPEIVVHDGATIADPELTDGQVAVVDFGTTTQGGGSARSFTIRNTGEVTLAVSSITAPAGFSVAGAPATVAPGANATFTVTLTAAGTGTFSGNVVINSNDLDEAAFDFPVTGVVNPQVVVTGGSPNAVVNVELGSLTGFTVTVRTPTPAITTYTLTRGAGSGNWLGTDVAGVVTGFGTTALNIIKAGVTTVNITDSNGANSVTFEGRAATTDATRIYEDNFTVMLNGALAGGVVFSGNNEFTGSASLTVAARGVAVGNVINVQANTTLQSVDGDITLSGNYFLADASSGGGTIHGITQQGTIRTTGSGDIVLNGRGGSGFAGSSIGINAASGAKLLVEGTGTVTLTGIGGPGNGLSSQVGCKGIRLVGAEVSSAAGAISMTGTSAALAGTQHSGIMVSGTIIQGTAPLVPVSISLNGTGASATDSVNSARSLHGVEITGASSIRTVKGSISIVGVAGTLPALSLGDTNYGVLIQDTAEVTSTGDATISIDGTGSIGGDDSMHGFLMTGTAPGSKVSVADGDLTITGTTGGSNDASSISHNGVLISNANLLIASTGSGNVSITGKRAAGTASAVSIGFQTQGAAAGSFQATGSGSITINADSMTLLGSNVIATSTSDITLRPHTAGLAVNLGAADSATQLGLTDTELDQVNAGTGRLIIGGASTGVITQSTAISRAALTNVVLSSGSASIPAINLSNGALTSTNGNVTLIGDAIAINVATGSIAAGTGTVALRPQTAATLIDLGGLDVAGTLGLTDGELDKVSAAALTVGSATSGAISTSAALSRTSATGISLVSAATITLSELIDTNGGNVSLTPGTSVLPTGTGTDLSMAASGTVSFSAGADLAISIEGNTANDEGSGYRQLSVVGGVNLTGSDLVLSGSYVPAPDDAFVIIANDGTDPVTGTFTSLTENTALVFNGRALAITYTGGDGNDVVLRRLKPTVTTLAALPVKALKATLRANVNANGFETTPINFELGTETGVYTSTHAAVPFTLTGGVTTLVSKLVLNLNQQTTYYYRTVATNEVGTTYGNEVSFTTPEAVPELYELVFAGGAGSTGSQVPGAPVGTTYQTFFGSPAIGSASTFAVRGQIKRPDTQIQHALFLGTGPDLFLRGQDTLFGPGDAVPAALPGGTYLNFFDPVLNADNRIAFLANVGGAAYVSGPRAVFTNIPDGTMKVIARQNATMGGFTFGIPSTVSVAGEGVLFLDSGGTRLFGWEPDQGTQLLFETGQSVGGKTVQAFEFVVGTGYASAQGRAHVLDSVSGNQKIALAVSFTDGSKGVVTGSIAPDGTVSGFDSSLVSTGEEINKFNTGAPIVQGATWSNSLFQKAGWDQTGKWFGFQAFLQSGTYPGGLVNSYNNSGLFIEVAPGETILQVREGEQAAGASAGVTYKDFYELSLGDNPAQYAFYADLRGPGVTSANMTGLWYKDSVGLKLAARTGSAAHGVVGGTFKTINLFGQPAQSRLGLIASLNGPGVNATNDLGYWGVNSLGEVKLGLREGQSFVTSAGSRTVSTFTMLNAGVGSNGASRGFTANGFFTALIAFTDGSQIIVEIEVP